MRSVRKEVQDQTPEPTPEPRFISEGVRNDIVQHGSTIDPLTGETLTAADLPKN